MSSLPKDPGNLTVMSGVAEKEEDFTILKADVIYLLMRNEFNISCGVRTQWFLDHLNKLLTVTTLDDSLNNIISELTVVSVIPKEYNPDWQPSTSHLFRYLVLPSSTLVFLSQTYSIVYCLDMSPSLSAVDIQHGQVMIDEVFLALEKSLDGLTRPFIIPGSSSSFQPIVYVTVIAHTPFFTTPAQQVLMQGYHVNPQNLTLFLESIQQQLILLEDMVAQVSGIAHEQLEAVRAECEKLVGGLFEDNELGSAATTHVPMVTPDSGFINMLRYGMLALQLLPMTSSPNLIVITDGIIAGPDIHVFDSVLSQLRTSSTACSFLHVGSLFHPHCCQGLVPYVDVMQFITQATNGVYMSYLPQMPSLSDLRLNFYHSKFLAWSFKKSRPSLMYAVNPAQQWHVSNVCFYGSREPQLLFKKQMEGNLATTLISVLCCRLREGYSIKSVKAIENQHMELVLVFPWKNHIYIEYVASAPLKSAAGQPSAVSFSVSIQAPYEFLHDITCKLKKPFQSQYRQAVVSRFWATLKSLTQSDQLLVHLNSFPSNPAAHTVPESIRSGMPVFYLPANSTIPVLSSTDLTCPVFATFWRPICMLDPSVWHKWLHTHRLGLLLQHDHPLPRHLHLANPSGRFQVVQCRQAAASLYALLKDISTFVLIENHSYVKLLPGESSSDRTPAWFYIMRATSKPPYIVINVAFLGGTPSHLRHQIVSGIRHRMMCLTLPQRPNAATNELACCVMLRKPVEKILIRYERMPPDLTTVVFPDGTQPANTSQSTINNPGLWTTLSRYLHHRRWIWAAQSGPNCSLGVIAVARILAIITKIRLQEGFHFAHSMAGIINMVLEVDMLVEMKNDKAVMQPCVIQYVLFPPHAVSACAGQTSKESGSEDEGTADDCEMESEAELQIVAEIWIEPQHGNVMNSPPERLYMENLPYFQLPDVICRIDAECISTLLALEQCNTMCSRGQQMDPLRDITLGVPSIIEAPAAALLPTSVYALNIASLPEQRIHSIPFAFNLLSLLGKCHQALQLYSMFLQDFTVPDGSNDGANLLLYNMLVKELKTQHNCQLDLNPKDSHSFSRLVDSQSGHHPLWRCFIKSISGTHITLTFLPAGCSHLKEFRRRAFSLESFSSSKMNRHRTNSVGSHSQGHPCPYTTNALTMPVYVFDCPLALLVENLVYKNAKTTCTNIYQDHTHKDEKAHFRWQPEKETSLKRSSPDEPKSDSSDNAVAQEPILKEQCRLISSIYCRCFVLALFQALHLNKTIARPDIQSGVDECEEALIEIDISHYMRSVCRHHQTPPSSVLSSHPCSQMQETHRHIKKAFAAVLNNAFSVVPTHEDVYFCILNGQQAAPPKESGDCSGTPDSIPECIPDTPDGSSASELLDIEDHTTKPVCPLFLHLACSIRSEGRILGTCPVQCVPTCFAELPFAFDIGYLDKQYLQVTLDVMCLTLPGSSTLGPLCIDGALEEFNHTDGLTHLPDYQHAAVTSSITEIKWLLQDEVAALALLEPIIDERTLQLIADHVTNSPNRPTCILKTVALHFVYGPLKSFHRFLLEFTRISVDGYSVSQEGAFYYLTSREADKPNFWLIMKIVDQESIVTYYHHRPLCIDQVDCLLYKDVQQKVMAKIKSLVKIVNQTLLLASLHDSRMCDALLEPEADEDLWKVPGPLHFADEDVNPCADQSACFESSTKLTPGCFACSVVWETQLGLHPRLKSGPGLSKGLQALRGVLNRFAVSNRVNMFVYQDNVCNVFYFRLHENADKNGTLMSRSSSMASLNEAQAGSRTQPSQEEASVVLKVHGITAAGPEVKEELVQVLQNRLDDAVLEVIAVMLARNPMCKLTPDDVQFIQKPGKEAEDLIRFSVPPHAVPHLQALAFYLRQNLLQFLHIPKYTESRGSVKCTFEDDRRLSENMFLYNQSPASGSKGIACLALAVITEIGLSLSSEEGWEKPSVNGHVSALIDRDRFADFTRATFYDLEQNSGEPVIEFRIWKQGRVNVEALTVKLRNALSFALWDLVTEFTFLTAPLPDLHVSESPGKRVSRKSAKTDCQPLSKIYHQAMLEWLEFAVELSVPAVRKCHVVLTKRHSLPAMVKEIQNLVISNASDTNLWIFRWVPRSASYQCWNLVEGLPHSEDGIKCLLLGRNLMQWQAWITLRDCYEPDLLHPKAQKGFHKFIPLLQTNTDGNIVKFVPRQRLLIAVVSNHQFTVYTYNWSKDRSENLSKQLTSLGKWLSIRAQLLGNIITQKMGLFHTNREAMPCELTQLVKFGLNEVATRKNTQAIEDIFRDSKPDTIKTISQVNQDPVVAHSLQMIDLSSSLINKENRKKLYVMWQTGGATPNIPLAEDMIVLFSQHSRVIHYCLTPVLFLPRWRVVSAATRDHTLCYQPGSLPSSVDNGHLLLCNNLIADYKQYLQTLGFIPIQTGVAKNSGNRRRSDMCYLQKSLLGGILLLELVMSEPFFHTKLHALECSRLQSKGSSHLSQFTLSFVDECDRIKVLLHLHSFTYDYHLRSVHAYLSGQSQAILCTGFHLTRFLGDFLKYYNKAPNYARNLVHADVIEVADVTTTARQLYDYLLSHDKTYKMEVFSMKTAAESEYVLVQISHTPHVTYRDAAQDVKQSEEFDVTLIIWHDVDASSSNSYSLLLNYFLILTSRREVAPKLDMERKLGKFCTVSKAGEGLKSDGRTEGEALLSSVVELREESVDYLGYYSSHEQLMQKIMSEQDVLARAAIMAMVTQGSVHCQTHLLWNKLQCSANAGGITFNEFCDLRRLSTCQSLSSLDERLTPLLCQSLAWYLGLVKVLANKYPDHHRILTSQDGTETFLIVLHPRYLSAFMSLSVNQSTSRGDLCVVYRTLGTLQVEREFNRADIQALIEGFINTCCYHLWISLL